MSLRGAQQRGNLVVVCKAVMHWRRDCHAIAHNDTLFTLPLYTSHLFVY
jgi:hypothetical protein